MSAKFTISKCNEEADSESDYYGYEGYDETIPDDYTTDYNALEPRGFPKKKRQHQPCIRTPRDNNTSPSSEEETQKMNQTRTLCLQKANRPLNSAESLLPPGESVDSDGLSFPSSQETHFEILPSDAFPEEELPANQHLQDVSWNLSLVHEKLQHNESASEGSVDLPGKTLVFGVSRPTQGEEMVHVISENQEAPKDPKPQPATPLETMDVFLAGNVTATQSKESFSGNHLAENLTLNAEKNPFKMDIFSKQNEIDSNSRLPGSILAEEGGTAQRGDNLLFDGATSEKLSSIGGRTFHNTNGTSSPVADVKSESVIQAVSLEVQNTPSKLEINLGGEDPASLSYDATSQESSRYPSHKATSQKNEPLMGKEALTTENTDVSSLVEQSFSNLGNRGPSAPLREDFLIEDVSSHEKEHDVKLQRKSSQDHTAKSITQLKMDTAAGNSGVLSSEHISYAPNDATLDLNGLIGNQRVTDKAVYTNDILGIIDGFSTHSIQNTADGLTLDERVQGVSQGIDDTGREDLMRFNDMPSNMDLVVEPNITPNRSAATIKRLTANITEKWDILNQKLIGVERRSDTGSKELVTKEGHHELETDVQSSENSADGTNLVSCQQSSHGCRSHLEKRSTKSRRALQEANVTAERMRSPTKIEGKAQALLSGAIFKLVNQTKTSTPLINDGDLEAPFSGRTGPSHPSKSILRHPVPHHTTSLDSHSETVQVVPVAGSPSLMEQAWRKGSSSHVVEEKPNIISIPFREKTALVDHKLGTKPGPTTTVFVEGISVLQKTTKGTNEAGVVEKSKPPLMVPASPESLLQSSSDVLQNKSLIERKVVQLSTRDPDNHLHPQESPMVNWTLRELWEHTDRQKEIKVFNGGGDHPPLDGLKQIFEEKKEGEEMENSTQGSERKRRVEVHGEDSTAPPDLNEPLSNSSMHLNDYDDYSNKEENKEDFDIYGEDYHDPRAFTGRVRQYFIAAVEVLWDYGREISSPYLRDK